MQILVPPIPAPPDPGTALLDLDLRGHLDDTNTFSWGLGTNWRVIDCKSLFTMALRTNDVQIAGADGSSYGNDWLDVKNCMMTLRASPQDSGLTYTALLNQIRRAFTRTVGTGARTVYFDGLGLMMIARVRASDPQPQVGQTHLDVAVQFTAADGLLYGQTLNAANLALSGGNLGGADMPMDLPVDFVLGTGGASSAVCTNGGTENANPIITINGPVPNPRIDNGTTGASIRIPITLGAQDSLVIDTKTEKILFNGVSPVIEDPLTIWPWNLPPGDSLIQFYADVYSDQASATVQWRDTSA